MLPDFIHIGPGRSGSTFIYKFLSNHPEVYFAKNIKETNFFNQYYYKGIGWYRDFFPESETNDKIKGEISNNYFYDPSVPERIKANVPNAKVITVLRNPYERIISVYFYRKSSGEIPSNKTFCEALAEYPDLISQNYYYRLLKSYCNQFSKEQLFIGFYDHLQKDPKGFLTELAAFIGAEPELLPDEDFSNVNAVKQLRSGLLSAIIKNTSAILRKYELFKIINYLKSTKLRKLAFKEVSKDQIDYKGMVEDLEPYAEKLDDEVQKLSQLLNSDLEHWKFASTRYHYT